MNAKAIKLCASCGKPSPVRKYCDECVSALGVTPRENPGHGSAAVSDTDGPSDEIEREAGSAKERLARHFPQVLDPSQVVEAAAVGSGGAMWLLKDRLVIKHFGLRGMLMQGAFKGELTILRRAITAITFREAGSVTVGFLQIDYMGAFPLSEQGRGGLVSELSSPGTVAFEELDQLDFLAVYRALMSGL